ncbi:MAG: glycosyltransferase family 2 protein [Nitrospinota bacterium]|nr:glycosyltransferase family 2 protein [Gammaproteobacteria bacterium]MDH5457200.1 glycosyltransferase family 2 protein [Nitrospinota bacterium]
MQEEAPIITVVSPCHNEQDNIPLLVKELMTILQQRGDKYEIILVDDGSRDETWSRIKEAVMQHTRIVGLKLSRNFGHQPALMAGLSRARGQAVISMDSDLQHPPDVLGRLISEWENGYKVVNTCREDTNVFSSFKRATSRYFYSFFSYMADVQIQEGASDFRLLDRQALEKLMEFAHGDGFLRGSVQWMGFPTTTITYQAKARISGESSYSLIRMIRLAVTAVTSFSAKPLFLGVWLGLFIAALSMTELIYVIVQALRGVTAPGWASMLGVTSFLFGMLFALVGIMGIYLARIYSLLQARPYFIVEEQTSIPQSSANRCSGQAEETNDK